jgi:hypothetical protein
LGMALGAVWPIGAIVKAPVVSMRCPAVVTEPANPNLIPSSATKLWTSDAGAVCAPENRLRFSVISEVGADLPVRPASATKRLRLKPNRSVPARRGRPPKTRGVVPLRWSEVNTGFVSKTELST